MNEIDSPCSLLIRSRIGWHPHGVFNRPSSIGELQITFRYPPGTEWGEHEYACLKEKLLDYLPKLIDYLKAHPTMMLNPEITNWYN